MFSLTFCCITAALLIAKVNLVTSEEEPVICEKPCEDDFHEECVTCPTPCPITCENMNGPKRVCSASCLKTGCQCVKGYVRDANKKCVLPSQCPGNNTLTCPNCVGPHKQCSRCYNSCRKTCKQILNPLEPTGPCLISCSGKFCTCADNYYLADDGECVLAEDCSFHSDPVEPTPICKKPCTGGKRDKCVFCGTRCPLTCDNLDSTKGCTKDCVLNVCRCEHGYARASDGRCVLPKNCPAKTSSCRKKYAKLQ